MEYFLDMDRQFSLYENAAVVLLPVPYDGTSTFVKGADHGPQAIIDASDSIELYDIEDDIEIYTCGIHTAKPIDDMRSPETMVNAVYQRTKNYLQDNKMVCVLGGEHSVSCGAIQAYAEKYDNLSVLQLDAHADLRDEYQNSPYNHACAMRRVQDILPTIVQVGIRSVAEEERKNIVAENIFYAHLMYNNDDWMQKAINRLSDNVYITIDLDCLDPSILPSTGTPLPGGMMWYEMWSFFNKLIAQKNIVGFDVVELCPNPADKSSDVLASVLVYKLITKLIKKQKNK